MEGAEGEVAVGVGDVQPAGFVVHEDREVVVHGSGLAVHLGVQVRADHQVHARLVQHGHHMHVQPALEEIVVLVGMVDHGHVKEAYLDGRLPEGGLLHRFLGPFDLLVQVVLVHVRTAVQDGAALARLAGIKDDEGDGTLAESVVEGRRIGVRVHLGHQLHIVAAAFVVSPAEEDRDPGGKAPERLDLEADELIQLVVRRRSDVAVQEQEVRRGGIHLRGEVLVPLDPVVDVVEHGETALRGFRVEGADTVPVAFVEGAEFGVAGVGVVLEFLPAHAVAEHRAGL